MNEIIQVLSSGGMYGKERIVKSLCKLSSDVIDIDSNRDFSKEMSSLSDSTYYFGLDELKKMIKERKYKIWHVHDVKSNFYVKLYSLFDPKIKVIRTYHGYSVSKMFSKKFLYSLVDLIIKKTNSWNISVFDDLSADQVIFNGVPAFSKEGETNEKLMNLILNEKGFLIGAIGRLAKEKNFKNLILGFIETASFQKNEAKLIIFGEGSERKELEKIVKDNSAEDMIFLPGFVKNLPSYLKYFDLIVQPSTHEGMPCSALESAIYSSATQIVSPVGALSNFINNGYVYSVGTDAASISKVLNSFLNKMKHKRVIENTTQHRRRKSDAFREYAKKSEIRMLNHYREMYKLFDANLFN